MYVCSKQSLIRQFLGHDAFTIAVLCGFMHHGFYVIYICFYVFSINLVSIMRLDLGAQSNFDFTIFTHVNKGFPNQEMM